MKATRDRFSNLNAALRKGQTGTKLESYKTWRADGPAATFTAPVQPQKGSAVARALLPFAFGSDFASNAVIKISGRSYGALASVGLTEVKLNLETVPETVAPPASYEQIPGFKPARIVIFKSGGTTNLEKSRITNANYKRRVGSSYTLPFGKKDIQGKRDQKGMRAQLIGALLTGCSGSFKEEEYTP